MNSLIFLSEQDFSIQQGKKGKLLCNNLSGISLVLFFSKQCKHCVSLYPIFERLPQHIPGCQFALLNVSTNPSVARMSQETILPLTHVPFLILFVNGKPFLRYNGEKSLNALANFVSEVLNRIQTQTTKNFTNNSTLVVDDDMEIPAFSVGLPYNILCEGETCYLKFGDAYKNQGRN